jgi:hypothetical protein
MLTSEEENYILANAYVPEHNPALITSLSAGEPFLFNDHFVCCKENWLIIIGYPLKQKFDPAGLEAVLNQARKKFRPGRISIIAPELPGRVRTRCQESNRDYYYTLDVRNPIVCSSVKRNLKKAAQRLTIECAVRMGTAHQALMREFAARAELPQRVNSLLFKMPQYVGAVPNSFVLNAWCAGKKLAAFYVIDFAAKNFSNYIVGCYSKKNYVIGASDLLLFELIQLSRKYDKDCIHLGLGISSGIRRFKEKWGAKPSLSYQMCELVFKKALIREAIKAMMAKPDLGSAQQ